MSEGPGAAAARAPTRMTARRLLPRRRTVVLSVAAAIALAGAGWITAAPRSVSTDDAYLQADSTVVASKVRGFVLEIPVAHNQPVRAGDTLLRIDPEEFDARVEAATAELAAARASLRAAGAALETLDADERVARAGVRSAETVIAAADAQQRRADADRSRFDTLFENGAATAMDVDHYRTAAVTATSDAAHARAALEVSRRQTSALQARRESLLAAVEQARASVARSEATLELARQDQAHTVVRAPADGVVGNRQAQLGDFVQQGSRLMTLVPTRSVYVIANFKETQLERMAAGQRASVAVDMLPHHKFQGRVESFAPGSGSQFALLPYEPGTGNFTKIVQRVPIRILLDPGQDGAELLRPGLSALVRVDFSARPRPEPTAHLGP